MEVSTMVKMKEQGLQAVCKALSRTGCSCFVDTTRRSSRKSPVRSSSSSENAEARRSSEGLPPAPDSTKTNSQETPDQHDQPMEIKMIER